MSRRGGFSCFTIDALIGGGKSRASPAAPRPQLSDAGESSSTTSTDCTTTSPKLQYVVSCSRLEDVCSRSPPPTTTATTPFFGGLDQRQEDTGAAESLHAFRVYRPASLDGVNRTADCGTDVQCAGDILATLQRRAMSWYHSHDVDNDQWRTPTLPQCDGRPINDITASPMPSAGHLHSHGMYRYTPRFYCSL